MTKEGGQEKEVRRGEEEGQERKDKRVIRMKIEYMLPGGL